MQFSISTPIDGISPVAALNQFNHSFFLFLVPSFPKLIINRFEGSAVGDTVDISLNVYLKTFRWVSKIIEREEADSYAFFIDKGVLLPPFLNFWEHKHLLSLSQGKLCLTDQVTFKTGFVLLDYLMYPVFYGQMFSRKSKYKKWFRNE